MRFTVNNTNTSNGNPSASAAQFRSLTPNSPTNDRFPHFCRSGSIQRQQVPEPTIMTPPPPLSRRSRPLLPLPTFKHSDKEQKDGDKDKEPTEKQTTAIVHSSSPPKSYGGSWTSVDLLMDRMPTLTGNLLELLVQLFVKEQWGMVFVARYRQDEVDDARKKDKTISLTHVRDADDERRMKILLRQTAAVLQEEKRIRRKALEICMELGDSLTPELKCRLMEAMSEDELDRIYAPFKPASEPSKAERAKALKLEKPAMEFLNGNGQVDLKPLVDKEIEDLATIEKVRNGVLDIISEWLWNKINQDEDKSSKMRTNQDEDKSSKHNKFITKLVANTHITVITIEKGVAENGRNAEDKTTYKALANQHMEDCKCGKTARDRRPTDLDRPIEPHQILKLHRQIEKLEARVVFDIDDDTAMTDFSNASRKYLQGVGASEALQDEILNHCYSFLIVPEMKKNGIWSHLNSAAQKSSTYWFLKGVGELLLAPPIPDCYILGVDPGFGHSVKVALIAPDSEPVKTGRFFLPECDRYQWRKHVLIRFRLSRDSETELYCIPCVAKFRAQKIMEQMADIVRKVGEKRLRIAIGNGQACRETQRLIAHFISLGYKGPFRDLEIGYRFVRECGSSPYSVSEASDHEFPTLNPLRISAVSIARRLQDAMSELVKCHPKHLGVGMYQHDNEELQGQLRSKTEEIVTDVGVDLNKCSEELLSHVEGLTKTQAVAIVQRREEIGCFTNRQQLLDVAEIDEKTFRQCAGFMHIYPTKKKAGDHYYNALDETQVHPDYYPLALRILAKIGLTPEAITNVENADVNKALNGLSDAQLAATPGYSCVVDALRKPPKYDYRKEVFPNEPIFFQKAKKICELKGGEILWGIVSNVTGFGVFVDVGVESSGLIHTSGLPRDGTALKITLEEIKIESKVVVKVLNRERDQFGLKLMALNGVDFDSSYKKTVTSLSN